jgi:hypothetical protein
MAEWRDKRRATRRRWRPAARASMKTHVAAMVDFWNAGVPTLDYGNNIRQVAKEEGLENAFAFPGFVPAYIRPLFCRGIGPFRWCALSGDPEDIYKTDAKMKELFPTTTHLHNWLDMARERIAFQGLPARICWVGLGDRHRIGLAFNEMVASGELKAPVVIGRDHLDSGSVASPNRETEAMKDGSDAVSDWPLLNALLNTASGATWVSLHHGGGVGMGFSQHAGMVIVADGTEAAARRLERVLWNDPATGVMRHADAGYDIALDCAREHGLAAAGDPRKLTRKAGDAANGESSAGDNRDTGDGNAKTRLSETGAAGSAAARRWRRRPSRRMCANGRWSLPGRRTCRDRAWPRRCWPTASPRFRAGASRSSCSPPAKWCRGTRRVRRGLRGHGAALSLRCRPIGARSPRASCCSARSPSACAPTSSIGWMIHGGGQALYDEMYGRFGLKPFLCGNSGPQWAGWFRTEINSPDDLGPEVPHHRPRLGDVRQARHGGEAMGGRDMFQALQSGALDAGEFIGPWTDSALGYYQVAKNYYWPGVGEPSSAEECGVNAQAYDELPDDLKQASRWPARASTTRSGPNTRPSTPRRSSSSSRSRASWSASCPTTSSPPWVQPRRR